MDSPYSPFSIQSVYMCLFKTWYIEKILSIKNFDSYNESYPELIFNSHAYLQVYIIFSNMIPFSINY
jgi:hypothetical protein